MKIDLPRDPWPDMTLALLRDPYRYISRRAAELGTDAFRTRLMGRTAVCMTGPEAARTFYRKDQFRREGAIPARIRKVLFGPPGVVQGLDGEAHRHRKAMFLDLVSDARMDVLDQIVLRHIDDRIPAWTQADDVDLYVTSRELLTAAVCEWAGVPLESGEAAIRADQMDDTFKHAASVGPAHLLGVKSRSEVQAWSRHVVEEVRAGRLAPPEGSAAGVIARWTMPEGEPIDADIAAAELLSVLRPTVANAVWFVFLAIALHRNRDRASSLADDAARREAFVQEVRRFYPFFPMLSGIAASDVDFAGCAIPSGTRVMLDVYGTNRDGRTWREPESFLADRFLDWPGDPFSMIPQGGGDHHANHRCPGEWISIRLMKLFAEVLTQRITYDVVTPDAEPDMRAVPALPRHGFRIGAVLVRS